MAARERFSLRRRSQAASSQVVGKRLARRNAPDLKSLNPTSDWSDFAVLASYRATLDPVRAWCHQNNVAYRLSERDSSGPKIHQPREACRLLDLLRNKPNRRHRAATLSRWFEARFSDAQRANP